MPGPGRPALSPEAKEAKKFATLPVEWKDAIASMTVDQIRGEIAKVAHDESENQKNKQDDQHLAEKKAEKEEAEAQYKEASDANKNKMKFALRVLEDKGGI